MENNKEKKAIWLILFVFLFYYVDHSTNWISAMLVYTGVKSPVIMDIIINTYHIVTEVLVPLLINKLFLKISIKDFGINRENIIKNIFIGISLSLLSIAPFYILAGHKISVEFWTQSINLYYIFIYIRVAITEEFFYRGFSVNLLSMKFSKITVIILSSLIFTFAHDNPISGFIYLFFSGVGYSSLFIMTGSLIAPMILHFSHNLFLGNFQIVLSQLGYENLKEYTDFFIALILLVPFAYKIYKDRNYNNFHSKIISTFSKELFYKSSLALIGIYMLLIYVINPNILVKSTTDINGFETYIIGYKGTYKKVFNLQSSEELFIGVNGGNFNYLEVVNLDTGDKIMSYKSSADENNRIYFMDKIERGFVAGRYQIKFKTKGVNRRATVYIKYKESEVRKYHYPES